MEIRDVEAIPLSYPLEDSYGSARGTVDRRVSTLVRVESTSGVVGWGEAFGPPRSTATIVDEVLADFVQGASPYMAQSLCEEVYAGLYHFGSSGLILSATSGVETAMWDLVGKSVGASVGRLLGGRRRSSVVPYASTMYITPDGRPLRDRPVAAAAEEGFTAAKIKIGRSISDDISRVAEARRQLGEEGYLMVDCNGNYRPHQAHRLIQELAPYDIQWLEEPLPPENLAGYRRLRQQSTVPLAAGEAAYSRFEFKTLLEHGVDVIQPDVCKCGGLAEARAIGQLCTAENALISPHVWSGGVGVAAALQYAASMPTYPHSTNSPVPCLFEFDRADNALRTELLETPFDPTGGHLEIPDEPGLGIVVDRDAVERYRITA